MIKPNIKEMIEVDIETLNNAIGIRKGSQELFNKITAKYIVRHANIESDMIKSAV